MVCLFVGCLTSQQHAAAHILNMTIHSVFPSLGWDTGIRLNHRSLMPSGHQKGDFHIMWTSNRSDMVAKHWVANHFVPLMPLHVSQQCEPVFQASHLEGRIFLTNCHGLEYVARVEEYFPKEKEVKLSYMAERAPGSGLWYWPPEEDMSHEPEANLLRMVELEMDIKLSNRRMQYYHIKN